MAEAAPCGTKSILSEACAYLWVQVTHEVARKVCEARDHLSVLLCQVVLQNRQEAMGS